MNKVSYKTIKQMNEYKKKLDTLYYVYEAMNNDYQKMKITTNKSSIQIKNLNRERSKLYLRMKELFDKDLDTTFVRYKILLSLIYVPDIKDILIEKYEHKHFRALINHYCV